MWYINISKNLQKAIKFPWVLRYHIGKDFCTSANKSLMKCHCHVWDSSVCVKSVVTNLTMADFFCHIYSSATEKLILENLTSYQYGKTLVLLPHVNQAIYTRELPILQGLYFFLFFWRGGG